jgi:two-component system, NarL family, sensor histidine kinase UhpB
MNHQVENRFLSGISYQCLVEQSLVGIYLIQDDILKYCNHAFAAISGYKPEQIIGRHISEMVAPESINKVLSNIHERIQLGPHTSTRYIHKSVHVDGYLVDMEVHGRTVEHEGRPAIAGVAINVTQRLKYEREFRESHFQLQQMTRYANRIREQNRQELAREIHDVLGGLLTAIKMDATRIIGRSHNNDGITEIAEDIIQLAQESIQFARSKSEQLYPATLNYLGLLPTLNNHARTFEQRTGIRCTVLCQHKEITLPADMALAIFRIVQESFTNVARHARALIIQTTVMMEDDQILVLVRDNGVGIKADNGREGALGILIMKERAAEFGGEVLIRNDIEQGTVVSLRIPLPAFQNMQKINPARESSAFAGVPSSDTHSLNQGERS